MVTGSVADRAAFQFFPRKTPDVGGTPSSARPIVVTTERTSVSAVSLGSRERTTSPGGPGMRNSTKQGSHPHRWDDPMRSACRPHTRASAIAMCAKSRWTPRCIRNAEAVVKTVVTFFVYVMWLLTNRMMANAHARVSGWSARMSAGRCSIRTRNSFVRKKSHRSLSRAPSRASSARRIARRDRCVHQRDTSVYAVDGALDHDLTS